MSKTIDDVIKELAEKRPHTYTDESVAGWISTLDGDISSYLGVSGAPIAYTWPDDRTKELFIPAPFDDIYFLFCAAQVDYLNREYDQYANSYAMYNSRISDFQKYYIRHNRPASAGTFTIN
ncbi:MAG: hypothetical protein VB058_05745 [Oscillospiraceae bacterium]|nr:hypothetical protein [Oscillospiraceae bacterium]